MRAESEGRAMATVSSADPSVGLAGYCDVRAGPARLGCERTTAALLAVEAVADGHPDRLALTDCAELAALAGSCT